MAHSGLLFSKTPMLRRTFVAWVAAFVLFAQALMPLTQVWAHDGQTDGELQVICTANGVQTISIGQGGAPIEAADIAFCPFCTLHAMPAVLMPQGGVTIVRISPPVAHSTFDVADQHISTSIWSGTPHPSRAPPVS